MCSINQDRVFAFFRIKKLNERGTWSRWDKLLILKNNPTFEGRLQVGQSALLSYVSTPLSPFFHPDRENVDFDWARIRSRDRHSKIFSSESSPHSSFAPKYT